MAIPYLHSPSLLGRFSFTAERDVATAMAGVASDINRVGTAICWHYRGHCYLGGVAVPVAVDVARADIAVAIAVEAALWW